MHKKVIFNKWHQLVGCKNCLEMFSSHQREEEAQRRVKDAPNHQHGGRMGVPSAMQGCSVQGEGPHGL